MSDFRDGINDYLVHAKSNAVNPAKTGTKAAAHLFVGVPAEGQSRASSPTQPD
jgi:hypothetical protein